MCKGNSLFLLAVLFLDPREDLGRREECLVSLGLSCPERKEASDIVGDIFGWSTLKLESLFFKID